MTSSRVRTYDRRRREKEELEKELHHLQSVATKYNIHTSNPSELKIYNDILRNITREINTTLHAGRSLLSDAMTSYPVNPLESYIYLSTDHADRIETLTALRSRQLRRAYDYILSKTAVHDLTKPYKTEQEFTNADGKIAYHYSDLVQFIRDDKHQFTVYSVFQTILSFFTTNDRKRQKVLQEGIREQYESVHEQYYNSRLIHLQDGGIQQETSTVMCAEVNEKQDYALICTDFVNEDELYPYYPSHYIRRDISAASLVSKHTLPDGREAIVLRRFLFVKMHNTQMDMSYDLRQGILESTRACPVNMLKLIHWTHARNTS